MLTNLSALYKELLPDELQNSFMDTYFKDMYFNENTSGDILAQFSESLKPTNNAGIGYASELAALIISCAYCVNALRATEMKELNEAWTYIVDARYWCGIPLSRRVERFFDREKMNLVSDVRRGAQSIKHELYYGRQERFVDDMYQSKRWKNKTTAAKYITNMLITYIAKETLPVEKTRDGNEKDWQRWVYDRLRSANGVKKYELQNS